MGEHPEQWKKIQTAFNNGRMPQALFLVGPLHCALADFALQIVHLLLCRDENKPCFKCNDCQMVKQFEHPDLERVKPDKEGGAIKIDQIRTLQQTAYLTPQRSNYRIIVIDAADRMNNASANALLKILEEPAKHTVFILIAQQLSTVLPTVLSRCQLLTFSSINNLYDQNLLLLGNQYPKSSDRALIFEQAETILEGIIALLDKKEHPCVLATRLTKFELSTLLWFLYLVYAQLQMMHMTTTRVNGPADEQLNQLSIRLNPVVIFVQIDKINTLLRKLSHNMNVNQSLALEDLLFSLVPVF